MSKYLAARTAGIAAIAVVCAATVRLNCLTIAGIWSARTRVPWADEWEIIREFMYFKGGSPLFPILWSSYWGHRLVIPRLVFFANLQWASWESLTWLTLAIQTTHIAVLCVLSWHLIGVRSRTLFAVSVVVIFNLMLSPLQMENFVWSMQLMFPLVYTAASVAFLCLALHREYNRYSVVLLCVFAAMVASYTEPDGLLVWPVLVAQAIYLRLKPRLTIAVGVLGAGVIASYCWRYDARSLGFGLSGMLHHPVDSLMLIGLLLAGALDSIWLWLGITVALLSLAGAVYMATKTLSGRPDGQSWLSALAAIIAFLFLSAASVVAGRLSPQWLSGGMALPSRYFTLIEAFWATLAILVLYVLCRKPRSFLFAGFYGALYLCLMFSGQQRQASAVRDWPDFFRRADAAGAAIILNAPDEEMLSILWTPKPQREEIAAYLRSNRLSVFAEPRAAWPGKQISELFRLDAAERCIGGMEKFLAVEDGGAGGRVEGWAWDVSANRGFDYLLLADSSGLVAGMARGGFRHGYFPGLLTYVPASPVSHMRFPDSEWFGYTGQPATSQGTVYGVIPHTDRICKIEAN